MSRPAHIGWSALACVAAILPGCGGETGAKITGAIVEDGQPLQVAKKDAVLLSLTPIQKDDESLKAHPGAEFKHEDSTFRFVGPGSGLVPPGEYKVCLIVRSRDAGDRFAGAFSPANTPLNYVVTDEANQEIVIDVKNKTVTRK